MPAPFSTAEVMPDEQTFWSCGGNEAQPEGRTHTHEPTGQAVKNVMGFAALPSVPAVYPDVTVMISLQVGASVAMLLNACCNVV